MGLSNRAISSKAVIKNGLIVHGSEPNVDVGPGYYSPNTFNGLLLHSYNVHAQQKTPVKPTLDFPDLHRFYASNRTAGGEISHSTSKIERRKINSDIESGQRRTRSQSGPRRQKPEPVTEYVTSPLYEQTKTQSRGEQSSGKSRTSRELVFTPIPYAS